MSESKTVVLFVGARAGDDEALEGELVGEGGFAVEHALSLETALERLDTGEVDVVLLSLDGQDPIERFETTRDHASDTAVVVLTESNDVAAGASCIRAGAEDHLVRGQIPTGLAPRALRYAVDQHRLRRELRALEIADELTGMPNLRGFLPIAEHHLRMADRSGHPVVFVFVQLDDFDEIVANEGHEAASRLIYDAAGVVMEAVRDSDVPAKIADDTFCVLLTGEAAGAEALVLSRLVEALAVHNTRSDRPKALSLSVGSALYDLSRPVTIEEMLDDARRRMAEQRGPAGRSEGP
jgi:diguanylate cyclase (GGDEF)-like protein